MTWALQDPLMRYRVKEICSFQELADNYDTYMSSSNTTKFTHASLALLCYTIKFISYPLKERAHNQMCERNPEISKRIIGDVLIHEYEGAKKPNVKLGSKSPLALSILSSDLC